MREVEVPRPWLRDVWFRNVTRFRYSGVAYWRTRIVVSVGPDEGFARLPADAPEGEPRDAVEALVEIVAHELYHIRQFWTGTIRNRDGSRNRDAENAAELAGKAVLWAFRADRAKLAAAWGPPLPAPAAPRARPDRRRANCERAAARLEYWQRQQAARLGAAEDIRAMLRAADARAQAAGRKVREYERKLARYEKRGVRPGPGEGGAG